jgi:alcohol dehydrogenase YqhD (iron-dependent ADH family)
MENFIAYNPTKVHFGKGVLRNLGEAVIEFGSKVLLIYGKGSVMKNGCYNEIMMQLNNAKAITFEYNGIKPNPIIDNVDAAASYGISNGIDCIVAAGGGSVIDSAKIISVCIAEKCKGWDVMKNRTEIKNAVPLITVLTLAATGTEMNNVAVLQNSETKEKIGYSHVIMYPRHSFLDPSYTASVPANYTAYGIVDLIAHAMESFFGRGEASLSDRFAEAIIKEAFAYGPKLMNDLTNYDLRANIMWAATNALNGLTGYGRATTGDWGVHAIGHVISFLYDTPHGATLSMVYPAWLKCMKKKIPERISKLGEHLFNDPDINSAINKLEAFFRSIGSPVNMDEAGLDNEKAGEILKLMNVQRASGRNYILNNDDREEIVNYMLVDNKS